MRAGKNRGDKARYEDRRVQVHTGGSPHAHGQMRVLESMPSALIVIEVPEIGHRDRLA